MSNEKISLDEIKKQAKEFVEDSKLNIVYKQIIVFKLNGEEYGLPIDQVKEVVSTPPTANVPHTPDYVIGAANIRGSVVAIIDLERKFELKKETESSLSSSNFTLVIENEQYKVGLLVKEVPNTLQINVNDIDNSSDVLQFSTLNEECVNGIAKLEDRMIILIDIIKMLNMNIISNEIN